MSHINLQESDLMELLYRGKSGAYMFDPELIQPYHHGCKELGQEPILDLETYIDAFQDMSTDWKLPDRIKNLDLEIYFAGKISTIKEVNRVSHELTLYKEHGLETMLRFMIYLVEVMRENNVIWGVGRGSSVSSFLLYLVGLHSVNSLKYNLEIEEFIR